VIVKMILVIILMVLDAWSNFWADFAEMTFIAPLFWSLGIVLIIMIILIILIIIIFRKAMK